MNTKSSTTLRYLESNEVFTLEEYSAAVDPAVAERTRYDNLQNAIERGQAYRVRRGLYASNLGVYRDRVPNVYLVAAKAAEGAVITHHSALEAHGVAHTPFRTVYFTSSHKIGDFEVRGYRFHRVGLPASTHAAMPDQFVTRVRVGEAIVPVSSKERTLIDCVCDLRLAGGIEELLRSLGGFTSVSGLRVAEYARGLTSPTAVARAGWVLEMFGEGWRVDASVLDGMRAALGRGTYRLMPISDGRPVQFVARWRLYVPAGLPYAEWVRG
jgi:predicted transcriptional regulator of viral defense system